MKELITSAPVPELGPLEFRILEILWRLKMATAGDILEAYNEEGERPLKYTTVLTLLTRMAEKGVVLVDRRRQPFHFRPRMEKDQVLRQRVSEFVDRFFDGRAVELAVRLVEESSLTPEALERLEKLVRRHREQEGETRD